MILDIGDLCTHCGRDTSFGSVDYEGKQLLLFVNRIPSHDVGQLVFANGVTAPESGYEIALDGYMCTDCQRVECHQCGELTLNYEIVEPIDGSNPVLLCEACHDGNIYRKEEKGE